MNLSQSWLKVSTELISEMFALKQECSPSGLNAIMLSRRTSWRLSEKSEIIKSLKVFIFHLWFVIYWFFFFSKIGIRKALTYFFPLLSFFPTIKDYSIQFTFFHFSSSIFRIDVILKHFTNHRTLVLL